MVHRYPVDIRARLILFVVVGVMVLSGCRHQVHDHRLERIAAIVSENPHEAMASLDSIDRETLSGTDRHYYDFLTVKSRDKAYVRHTSDSLYLSVLDYYKGHRDDPLYPEVLYYGGRVYSDLGDYPRALNFFQSCIEIMPEDKNDQQLRLNTISHIGWVLTSLRLYTQAIPYLEECISTDIQLRDSVNLISDLCTLGSAHFLNKEYEQAEKLLNKAYQLSLKKDSSTQAYIQGELAILKFFKGRNDSALDLIRGVPERVMNSQRDYILSYATRIYYNAGILDTALLYAKEIKDSREPTWSRSGYKILLSPGTKDYLSSDSIEFYLNKYLQVLEEIYNENEKEAAILQNNYYNYSIYKKENYHLTESKYLLTKWLFFLVIVVFVSFFVILILKYKNIKTKIKYIQAIDTINTLNQRPGIEPIQPNEISSMSSVEQMRGKWEFEKNKYIEKLSERKEFINSYLHSKGYEIVRDYLEKNENIPDRSPEWGNVYESFTKETPNFKERLERIANSRIKDEEYRLIILIRYGLTSSEISILLSKSKSTITYRRQMLSKKLFGENLDFKKFDTIIQRM